MADGYQTALQVGLIARLKAYGPLIALVGSRVVETPKANIILPYVRLWRMEGDPYDTDDGEGFFVTFSFEVHSRSQPAGQVEAKHIGEAVVDALHRQPGSVTATGFDVVDIQFLTSSVEAEDGDNTVAQRLAFEARLDRVT